ncbi:MAG: helix-turn-helix transcriptional regulator [Alphaproteobacteria bacterium]|nr:helix-turn-helix transcriptional regulator [Alphaproteobacteria bacterium]
MSGKPFAPTPVDQHIGQRMQQRRLMMGMSQKDLADVCGVTFQQIQKYETAGNRISASRLFTISSALEIPVTFFFKGLPGYISDDPHALRTGRISDQTKDDPLGKTESLQLINLYWKLPSDEMRETVMKMMRHLNGAQ